MWSPANITRVVSDAKFNASRHSHSVAWAASSIKMWVKKPVQANSAFLMKYVQWKCLLQECLQCRNTNYPTLSIIFQKLKDTTPPLVQNCQQKTATYTTASVSRQWRKDWKSAMVIKSSLVDRSHSPTWRFPSSPMPVVITELFPDRTGPLQQCVACVKRNRVWQTMKYVTVMTPDNVTHRQFLCADQTLEWSSTSTLMSQMIPGRGLRWRFSTPLLCDMWTTAAACSSLFVSIYICHTKSFKYKLKLSMLFTLELTIDRHWPSVPPTFLDADVKQLPRCTESGNNDPKHCNFTACWNSEATEHWRIGVGEAVLHHCRVDRVHHAMTIDYSQRHRVGMITLRDVRVNVVFDVQICSTATEKQWPETTSCELTLVKNTKSWLHATHLKQSSQISIMYKNSNHSNNRHQPHRKESLYAVFFDFMNA